MTKEEFEKQINKMNEKMIERLNKAAIENQTYQIFIDIRKTFLGKENDTVLELKTTILVKKLIEAIGHEFANIIEAITAISMLLAISAQIKEDKEVGFDFDYDLIMFYPDGNQKILNFKEEYQNFLEFKEKQADLLSYLIN